jgi:uncharacterized protein YlxW (UPF0749 family)
MAITTHSLKCLITQLDDEFFSYSSDLEEELKNLREESDKLKERIEELEEEIKSYKEASQ